MAFLITEHLLINIWSTACYPKCSFKKKETQIKEVSSCSISVTKAKNYLKIDRYMRGRKEGREGMIILYPPVILALGTAI